MCKICSDDALPAFLCRACNPSLVPTDAQRKLAADVFKAQADRINTIDRLRREQHKAQAKLKSAEKRNGAVDAKIAKSMRNKLTRIAKELEALAA